MPLNQPILRDLNFQAEGGEKFGVDIDDRPSAGSGVNEGEPGKTKTRREIR